MSCYTRHLAEFLPADPSAADNRALDRAVRKVLGMEEADCPDVWEQVKARRDEHYFVSQVIADAAVDAATPARSPSARRAPKEDAPRPRGSQEAK